MAVWGLWACPAWGFIFYDKKISFPSSEFLRGDLVGKSIRPSPLHDGHPSTDIFVRPGDSFVRLSAGGGRGRRAESDV